MGQLKISRQVYNKINADYLCNRLLIFVSYSSTDRNIANLLKDSLEKYGISVFLSDYIKPTSNWIDEIEKNLQNCHIFLPILSHDFSNSDWTNQETGFAFSKGKIILPLKIEEECNPTGFIRHCQAMNIIGNDLKESSLEVIEIIRKKRALKETLVNSLIYALQKVPTYAGFELANEIVKEIVKAKKFSKPQLDEMLSISIKNPQVRNSTEFVKFINSVKKKPMIDTDLLQIYESLKDTYDLVAISK